jgi:CHAD domain-containing protein
VAALNGKKAPGSPVVKQIAQALGEDKLMALGQIKRIVQTIGEERALAILQQALEREQQGGLLLPGTHNIGIGHNH